MAEEWDLLRRALAEALGADAVLADAAARGAYAVQGRAPALVARPADADGVGRALALASEAGAAVVPWGGGTSMALGYPPRAVDLVLSLERLNAVVAHDPADLTATVQAGCTVEQVARALAPARQMLPLDAPLPARATIGGTLATGLAGPRRLLYGNPRDLLLGVRVVDASGVLTSAGGRVVKNVTGYDLTKLYVGSLGTLGVLVEANFKLVPIPEAEGTVLATAGEPVRALAAAQALTDGPVAPAAVAVLPLAALPQLASRIPAADGEVVVAARFPGPAAAVERALDEGRAAARAAGCHRVARLDGAAQTAVWAAIADFPALVDRPADEALLKLSVLPSELGTVVETAGAVAAEHGLRLLWLADAGTGTTYLQVRAARAAASANGHGALDAAMESVEGAEALAPGLGALQDTLAHRWRTAVVLACAPELKVNLAIWGANPPAIELMHDIKHRFDPTGTLNPGRFVGGL
jgi:glycolate oxidase FAD binding subunit